MRIENQHAPKYNFEKNLKKKHFSLIFFYFYEVTFLFFFNELTLYMHFFTAFFHSVFLNEIIYGKQKRFNLEFKKKNTSKAH